MTRPVRFYGKATGSGPWHLQTDPNATTSLCGRHRHYRYHGTRRSAVGVLCSRCRAEETRLKAPPEGVVQQ